MAIANRIRRLFHADVHAILDVIEEPEAILKQAIREMQEALDLKRVRLARNEKSLGLLETNKTYLTKEIAKIQEDLALALKEGSEELARKILGRKLAFQKYLASVQQRISSCERLCERQTEQIELQQGQLESIVEKARLFVHTATEDSPFSVADSILSASGHGAGRSYPGTVGAHVSDDEIELEWIRIRDSLKKGGAA